MNSLESHSLFAWGVEGVVMGEGRAVSLATRLPPPGLFPSLSFLYIFSKITESALSFVNHY